MFEPLKQNLESSGLTVHISALVSTRTTAAEGLTVEDDRAAICLRPCSYGRVELDRKGPIVFLHSASGFLCYDAMKGLTEAALQGSE